jgi:hypothetical protein
MVLTGDCLWNVNDTGVLMGCTSRGLYVVWY